MSVDNMYIETRIQSTVYAEAVQRNSLTVDVLYFP